jgi:phosphoglycolate phosphatase-like HAD superfamily hydrolase
VAGGGPPEAPLKLAGAIFDLDGTLVDTLPICFSAFRDALVRLGERRYEDHEIRALFGPSEEGMMQRAVPARWEAAVALYLEPYERELTGCPPIFAGLAPALSRLRARGVPCGLVTGKGPVSTAMSLRHFGLHGAFDVVESGSPAGVVKADAIRRTVGTWGLAPATVIYAGDAVADIESAREAGVTPVAAAWAPSARAAELRGARPAYLFTEAEAFAAWVESVTVSS